MKFGKVMNYNEEDPVYIKLTPEDQVDESNTEADELLEHEYDIVNDYSSSFITREQLPRFIQACSELHKRPMNSDEYSALMKIIESGEYQGEFAPHYVVLAAARIIKENFRKFNPSTTLSLVDQILENTFDLQRAYEEHYQNMLDNFRSPFLIEGDIMMEKTHTNEVSSQSFEHPMLAKGLIPRRR